METCISIPILDLEKPIEAFIWLVILTAFATNLQQFEEEPLQLYIDNANRYIKEVYQTIYPQDPDLFDLSLCETTQTPPTAPRNSVPASLMHRKDLTFVEFFSGVGNTWRGIRANGSYSLGLDITYWEEQDSTQNPFDILSNAGIACQPKIYTTAILN